MSAFDVTLEMWCEVQTNTVSVLLKANLALRRVHWNVSLWCSAPLTISLVFCCT